MAEGASYDTSQVRVLELDMGRAGTALTREAGQILEKAAVNIKAGLQREAGGHPHFPRLPSSISYDVRGLTVEIGPTIDRAPLAGVFYDGTPTSAPVADIMSPVRAEEPKLAAYLGDAAARATLGEA